MRHRWLGPLFVILFGLMLSLLFLHAMHDSHETGGAIGEFCLGLTIMFSLLIVIRLRWRVVVSIVQQRFGRAPPAPRFLLPPVRAAVLSVSPPLRL